MKDHSEEGQDDQACSLEVIAHLYQAGFRAAQRMGAWPAFLLQPLTPEGGLLLTLRG